MNLNQIMRWREKAFWGQYRLDIDEIKELLIFLGVTMGLCFAGECSYSEKAHTEIFQGEVS